MYKNFMGKLNRKQQLLNLYNNDLLLSKIYKGWIKQEINRDVNNIRNPPGIIDYNINMIIMVEKIKSVCIKLYKEYI